MSHPKHNRTCRQCGVDFYIKPSAIARGYGIYCGKDCHNKAQRAPRRPIAERFWEKVSKSSDPNGCWIWIANPNTQRRGVFIVGKLRRVMPARMAWELTNGPIPDGLEVCHNCPGGDNPRCVRPDHLFLGTHLENMTDAANKGQMAHGERHAMAKLTTEIVLEIRDLYASGVSQHEISRRYNLSQGYVSMLVRKKWWRHL